MPETNDPIAAFDQMGAILVGLAEPLRSFHKALLKEGFTHRDAISLVNTCLCALLTQGGGKSE